MTITTIGIPYKTYWYNTSFLYSIIYMFLFRMTIEIMHTVSSTSVVYVCVCVCVFKRVSCMLPAVFFFRSFCGGFSRTMTLYVFFYDFSDWTGCLCCVEGVHTPKAKRLIDRLITDGTFS